MQYPNLPSALQPIPHSNELPVPAFKALEISDSESDFVPTEDTKDIMKNLMLQEDLAEFPNCSHRLIWMTWWGILIYRKIQLNYLLPDSKIETC